MIRLFTIFILSLAILNISDAQSEIYLLDSILTYELEDTGQLDLDMRELFTYNNEGQLIVDKKYSSISTYTGVYDSPRIETLQYLENSKITERKQLDSSNTVTLKSKKIEEFDVAGKPSYELRKRYDAEIDTYVNSGQTLFVYEDDKLKEVTGENWNNETGAWQKSVKSTTQYNEQDLSQLIQNFRWSAEDSEYIQNTRTENTYDSLNRIQTRLKERRKLSGEWIVSSLQEFTYEGQSLEHKEEIVFTSRPNGELRKDKKYVRESSGNSTSTLTIFQANWMDDYATFRPHIKYLNEYDENGKLSTRYRYSYEGGEEGFVNDERKEYFYSALNEVDELPKNSTLAWNCNYANPLSINDLIECYSLDASTDRVSARLFDISGKPIFETEMINYDNFLLTQNVRNGMYFLHLENRKGDNRVFKIMVGN